MANIKSSKKDIKRIKIKTARNKARMSEIKTLVKKFKAAIAQKDLSSSQELFKVAQSKLSRAKGKGLLKANSVSRKISSLAKGLKSIAA